MSLEIEHIEIYNDQVYDLLCPNIQKVLVCENSITKEFELRGTTSVPVSSLQDSFQTILRGERNRIIAITSMNHQSSRSHTIVRMKILVHEPNSVTRESIISFVDLAGSEKIDKHKKMPISSTLQNQKEQEKTRAMHTRIQEGK